MAWLVRCALVALLAIMPVTAMAGPAEDGAAAIDRWVAAYNANDLDALMKAYAPDAILQGTSEPQINVGTADLRKYFRNLPKGGSSSQHPGAPDVRDQRHHCARRWHSIRSRAARRGSRSWRSSAATTG